MRMLRLSLAGMVTLALLGVSVGAVLAQTDEEQAGGSGTFSAAVDVGHTDDWVWDLGHPYGTMYDWSMVIDAEATDPRFSGTWTLVMNNHGFGAPGAADSFMVSTGTALLENDDGTWAGEIRNFSSEAHESLGLVVEGEGAYAGYAAMLELADREWNEFKGVVFEGGLPPMPDPVEPSAAEPEAMAEEAAPEAATEVAEGAVEAEVTAEEEGDDELSGTAVYIDGLRTWQNWEDEDTIYELEMSDPRADGTYTEFDFVGDGYDSESELPSVAALGHVTLVNEQGSWSGHESAVWDDEMGWRLTAWLAGEDAYEGLTLYLHAHRFPVYSTPEMEFDGVIFEGEPPVMLDAVTVPAE